MIDAETIIQRSVEGHAARERRRRAHICIRLRASIYLHIYVCMFVSVTYVCVKLSLCLKASLTFLFYFWWFALYCFIWEFSSSPRAVASTLACQHSIEQREYFVIRIKSPALFNLSATHTYTHTLLASNFHTLNFCLYCYLICFCFWFCFCCKFKINIRKHDFCCCSFLMGHTA